jgi:hypothetical protein
LEVVQALYNEEDDLTVFFLLFFILFFSSRQTTEFYTERMSQYDSIEIHANVSIRSDSFNTQIIKILVFVDAIVGEKSPFA